MDDIFYPILAVTGAGAMSWQLAALHIERWLSTHDPTYEPPSVLARMFIGRLFSTLGSVGRYTELRAEHNLPPYGAYAFWGGLALALLGLFGLFAVLGSL